MSKRIIVPVPPHLHKMVLERAKEEKIPVAEAMRIFARDWVSRKFSIRQPEITIEDSDKPAVREG